MKKEKPKTEKISPENLNGGNYSTKIVKGYVIKCDYDYLNQNDTNEAKTNISNYEKKYLMHSKSLSNNLDSLNPSMKATQTKFFDKNVVNSKSGGFFKKIETKSARSNSIKDNTKNLSPKNT